MANITGSNNADTLQGTVDDDQILGLDGNDLVAGEDKNDTILGGDGNDTIFGDAGFGTALGQDATALKLEFANLVSDSTSNWSQAVVNDYAIYKNIAQLEDGTQVSAILTLTAVSSRDLTVNLSGGTGSEILLNAFNNDRLGGETASFKLEFFIPDPAAPGNPTRGISVALNSTATFNDLDQARPGSQEAVTLQKNSFNSFSTSDVTSLTVTQDATSITATGTESNDPSDTDAWFSASFENREFLEFTLESRSENSGFTLSGDLIPTPNLTEVEAGNDSIMGGAGDDVILGQGGKDYIDGGTGNDQIDGGNAKDTIFGGEGDDTIDGGIGNDSIHGDTGNDEIYGGTGQDTIQGGGGNDRLEGGSGDDSIAGDAGRDTIEGGDGNDSLDGGAGNDLVDGGVGEDTLLAGPGDDTLTGGLNSDLFKIIEAGAHIITGGEDPDGQDYDIIDLRALDAKTFKTGAESGRIEFYDPNGNIIDTATYSEIEQVICFTPGSLITTANGTCTVENLRPGEKILTRDNGMQELVWTGRKDLDCIDLRAARELWPVTVAAGSLGNGLPTRDLTVSPNHRFLILSAQNRLLFDEAEVLIAAKFLVGRPGITQTMPSSVSYIHLMFQCHEVILSDDVWTESFHPGTYALTAVEKEQRNELLTLFPELRHAAQRDQYRTARLVPKAYEARVALDAIGRF